MPIWKGILYPGTHFPPPIQSFGFRFDGINKQCELCDHNIPHWPHAVRELNDRERDREFLEKYEKNLEYEWNKDLVYEEYCIGLSSKKANIDIFLSQYTIDTSVLGFNPHTHRGSVWIRIFPPCWRKETEEGLFG